MITCTVTLIRRTNTGNATFDHEGNTANEPWRKTDHRRTIDFGLWQAGLLRYVGQDPHYVVMGMVRATRHGKQRFPGRRRRHTPRSRSGCLSRPGRSPNHEDRARECQIISAPPRGCWSGRRQEAINSTRRRCRRHVKLGLPALA